MNIKLKALLLSLGYVAAPFVFVTVAFTYPLIILFATIALIVWMVYNKVLYDLEHHDRKKNGYSFKEFDEEYGGPR